MMKARLTGAAALACSVSTNSLVSYARPRTNTAGTAFDLADGILDAVDVCGCAGDVRVCAGFMYLL